MHTPRLIVFGVLALDEQLASSDSGDFFFTPKLFRVFNAPLHMLRYADDNSLVCGGRRVTKAGWTVTTIIPKPMQSVDKWRNISQ